MKPDLKKAILISLISLAVIAQTNALSMKDGIYEGRAFKFPGMMKVSVTVAKGLISDIRVTRQLALKKYTDMLQPMIERMITAQSPEVDGVTGATMSSLALKNAVKNALKQASH